MQFFYRAYIWVNTQEQTLMFTITISSYDVICSARDMQHK